MSKNSYAFYAFVFVFCFALTNSAQNLTVKDMMREPSPAGMRPESEKLSPDGNTVVYAWNADGIEPRNLYIVDLKYKINSRILVDAAANYEQRMLPPASKLDYGLTVRDDFQKAREKNLGGVEFSPDSKRILFLQNTDIYVLELKSKSLFNNLQTNSVKSLWKVYESQITRRVDLIPKIIEVAQTVGVQEKEIFGSLADARAKLLNALLEKPAESNGDQSEAQKQRVLQANGDFDVIVKRLSNLQENYPQLRASEKFVNLQDELQGIENRISVAQVDYDSAVNNYQSQGKPRRITRTQGVEAGARWLTNDSILYASGGNYFVLNLKETSLIQVTKEANPAAFVSIFNVTPTKDGKMLAYVLSDGSKQKALFVPNYLDEFVQANSTRRGFTEQKVFVNLTDGSREKPFEINLPKAEGAGYIRSIDWAADNSSLVVDRIDQDLKRRQLFYVYNVGSKGEQTILVTEERDEKWIAPLSRIVEPNPKDAAQILFASEKDGFNHLYLATLERAAKEPNPSGEIRGENPSDAGFTTKVEVKQLTKGNWQVEWAKWEPLGKQLLYLSTEKNTNGRQFSSIQVNSADSKATGFEPKTTSLMPPNSDLYKGMITNPQMGQGLLFSYSEWNKPTELYTGYSQLIPGSPKLSSEVVFRPITNSVPESFKQIKWNAPEFVDIPTRDGKIIKSKIYLPENFAQNRAKRIFPMVIFVHGAGYLQNTINGWNNYYREFMFNEMLTAKGYVVLDIDYRGSAGYGRDWRTDVYDFLGGKDYEDHLDAIDFAVKNYAVDAKKIGVYGGSYGGFMAEMLAFRTDKINCAAALRPVADWKNYYYSSPVYTAERLGFPEKNVEGYKRSSPIAYADGLNKPLLILHGLVDDNVPAQDSMQLIEKLIRLEKTAYFDAMLYPAESHGFTRPTSWTDEYERIFAFFERHLKN